MTDFYLKKHAQPVAGPFTGIELREAALAGVVFPQDGVAASPHGPWVFAADIGLFSEAHLPLPHPAGTAVPEFRLAGANVASQGPLQLRALIELAIGNQLPRDASIQPVGRPDWIPVNQFGILGVCVRGELSHHRPAVTPPPVVHPPRWSSDRSPTPAGQQPGMHSLPRTAPSPIQTMVPYRQRGTEVQHDSVPDHHHQGMRKKIRRRRVSLSQGKVQLACVGVCIMLVGYGLLGWIMRPSASRIDRREVVGSWISMPSHQAGQAFGISFKDDGTCVVFNSDGNCWSGDFRWSDAASRPDDPQRRRSTDADVVGIATHHHRMPVQESDGYLQLKGGATGSEPMLNDQPIRECFVRRDGEYLWIGYNAHVDLATGSESLHAGWMTLWPSRRAAESVQLDGDVRGTDLLSRYSMPDEARLLNPAEIDANRVARSAQPRSLIRYNALRLTLFADGSVRRFKDPNRSASMN